MTRRTPGTGPEQTTPGDGDAPAWVRAALRLDVRSATRARWGFRHETWLVAAGDERLVVQRRADGTDPTLAPRVAIRQVIRDAGLPVPEPVRVTSGPDAVVVVLPYIDGVVAADLLRGGSGAGVVGRACGTVAARLASIDPGALAAAGLEARGSDHDERVDPGVARLPDPIRAPLERYLHEIRPRLTDVPRIVAHGDLAPVNVLVRDDRVAAVLDFDRVRLAHANYDAAWYAWVVGTHHPGLIGDAWQGFADAAGMSGRSVRDVAWLWPLQLFERVREAQDDVERTRWLEHLGDALRG